MPSGRNTRLLSQNNRFHDMENPKAREDIQENVQEFHLPEWETTARHRGETRVPTGQKSSVKKRLFLLFESVMPGHRKYFGCSRKIACIIVLVGLLILLALILGLAIGLSKKSRYVLTQHKSSRTCSLNLHPVTIKTCLWDRRLTQAISPITALDSVPVASLPQTLTILSPSVTSLSMLFPKARIQTTIRCADTN